MSKKPTKSKAPAKRRRAKYTPAPKAAAPKKVGIIATIIAMLQKPGGATIDAMVAELTKRFPDRKAEGMRNTVKIQTSRQGAKRDDDGRYALQVRRAA